MARQKGRWKEVVRLTFKGERFRDHALDLYALSELSQFQKMVLETAKTLWREANQGRVRLPAHFDDRTRLCLRAVEEGSAVVPLEVFLEDPDEPALWQEPREVEDAIGLAHDVFLAAHDDKPLPSAFPRSLVPEYARWAQRLGAGESIELSSKGRRPVSVTQPVVKRLERYREPVHENVAEVVGEVLEADLHMKRFQLWIDDRSHVTVNLAEEHEDLVTDALRKHHSVRMRVQGKGDFDADGRLLRIEQVTGLSVEAVDIEHKPCAGARSIEEELEELAAEVPDAVWEKLPGDLGENLDHYLHGTRKREKK